MMIRMTITMSATRNAAMAMMMIVLDEDFGVVSANTTETTLVSKLSTVASIEATEAGASVAFHSSASN